MHSSTASLCGRADALGEPHPLSLPWSRLVGDSVMLGVAHLWHLSRPSCHPLPSVVENRSFLGCFSCPWLPIHSG